MAYCTKVLDEFKINSMPFCSKVSFTRESVIGAGRFFENFFKCPYPGDVKNTIQEKQEPEDCSPFTPSLVLAVADQHFKTNLTVIIFDGFYYADINFKEILNEILKGLQYSNVMFGTHKNIFMKQRENEQPSWVIFSHEMEAVDGKTLLVSHNSPFKVKEWLITPTAKKYMDIVALSDPALKKDRGGKHDCDIGLYTHSLNEDNMGGATASIITSWRRTHFTQKVQLYPHKYAKGFKRIHLIVAAEITPPFTFQRLEQGEKIWDGIEVRLLHHLAKALNFTYDIKEVNTNEKGKKALSDLKDNHANIAIGRQVISAPTYHTMSMTYPHSIDCAVFISLASTALPKYRAIMGPFLWDVWIALTAAYLLVIIPLAFSAWHTLRPLIDHPSEIENMFWYVFGTFTNLFTFSGDKSWTRSIKCSTKLFIGTYWVFTIIITACYTGSIIAFITLPFYPEVVDTLHQLLHRNYRVLTIEEGGWWELLTSSQDDEASGLAGTAQVIETYLKGIAAVVASAKEDKPMAFFGSKEYLTYLIKANFTDSKVGKRQMFHISKECFVSQLISFTLPLKSLYTDKLNDAILRAAESGFLTKAVKDIEWKIYKSSVRTILQGGLKMEAIERQLTLDDTQGMFLLLGSGFAIAVCTFAFEVGTWIKNRDRDYLTTVAKERLLNVSRRVSRALLAPASSHFREHYPLYFRSDKRRRSSLFGSLVTRAPAFSDINLRPPPVEKPIRLLSF